MTVPHAETRARHRAPWRAALALTALTATTAACASGAATDDQRAVSAEPSVGAGALPRIRTVTLITGDRVHALSMWGRTAYQVEPGPGRAHVTFTQVQSRRGTAIIPGDAALLLAADRLDARLFDVTRLLADGFDDAHLAALPLIVTHTGARARAFAPPGSITTRPLPSIGGAALSEDKRHAATFWAMLTDAQVAPRALAASTDIAKVWLDGHAHLSLDRSVPQIGGAVAHARGLTGKGVTVAVLDTGIRLDHPDFQGRVAEARDFTSTVPTGDDDNGHGTHCAGAIAGSGAASNGKYQGVAPEATLISGKVCNVDSCPESAIIAGMEWAAPKARVVSMSLGGGPTDGTDPLSLALNRLSAQHGTLFVVAAGNEGESADGRPLVEQVGSPASADAALAVASVTKQDEMSAFSSRGPRVGDGAVKPEIAAPGSDIVSARAKGTPVGDNAPVDDFYCTLSGTSMATPHVAGAAALLAQQHPDWKAPELKAALMSMSTPLAGPTLYEQGAGRVDLARATAQSVYALTPSVSLVSRWPHAGGDQTGTLRYRNDGAADVTLALSISALDPTGQPAPAGMFATAADRLTVPAHGSAETRVLWHPRDAAIGAYGARITAVAGDVRVVIAVGGYDEAESYDLTLRAIDRDGHAPAAPTIGLVDTTSNEIRVVAGLVDGAHTIRARKGTYDVIAAVETPSGNPTGQAASVTMLAQPATTIDRDTTITLDARLAKPVTFTVDRPDAVIRQARINVQAGEPVLSPLVSYGTALFATPTPHDPRINFQVRAELGEAPGASDRYRYNLVVGAQGQIPQALAYRIRDEALARVESRYHGQGVAVAGGRWSFPGFDVFDTAWWSEQALPARRTEYYTVLEGLSWFHMLTLSPPVAGSAPRDEVDVVAGLVRQYTAGSYQADWNRAPIGPAAGADLVYRNGDRIRAAVALFSPSDAGHDAVTRPETTGIAGSLVLARDGVELARSNLGELFVDAPADDGAYTLTASATRTAPWSRFGTRIDATWSFRSAHVDNADPTRPGVPLPLIAVRASGEVDDLGVAPGGQAYPLALRVERQEAATPSALGKLELEVSYDDGATWTAATVARTEDGGTATLQHPAGEGFVSLRSRAADAAGNAVTQTVVRAYAFRGDGPAPTPDAGSGGGSPDAGASPDAGRPRPSPDDGCGCATGGSPASTGGLLIALLCAGWMRRRTRIR